MQDEWAVGERLRDATMPRTCSCCDLRFINVARSTKTDPARQYIDCLRFIGCLRFIYCLRFIGCLRFIDCLHTQMSSASYTVRALLYVGLVRCIICVLLSLRYLPPVYCDAPPTGACKYVCALRTIIGSLSIVESKSRSW